MRLRLLLCAGAAIVPLALTAQAARVEHFKHGDTTIVRTTGNGVWGPLHDAIEVKRIGGESKETTFGDPSQLKALPRGGVLFFDTKAFDGPTIRIFDRDGNFVRNVGRRGDGPGEFKANGQEDAAVAPDGSFVLRRSDGIVNRYRADGTFINAFRFDPKGGGRLDISAGPGGSTYIRGGARPNTDMAYVAVHRYDTAGTRLDSLLPAPYLEKPPASNYDPLEWWFPLPDGRIVATRTDRLGFLIRSGPARRTLFLADVVAQAPLYVPEERAELQATADMMYDGMVRYGRATGARPVVPEHKQLFMWAAAAIDGNIWGTRRTTSVKGEPQRTSSMRQPDGTEKWGTRSYYDTPVYSGFRLDGTYLGDVRFPAGANYISFVGDYAWATIADKDGTPYLVKYRLH